VIAWCKLKLLAVCLPNAWVPVMRYSLRLTFGCVAVLFIVYCVLNAIKYERLSRLRKDNETRQLTVLNPFRSVKDGRSSTNISDLELLEMLSDDSDCVENLASVTFSSVSFRDNDGPKLAKLKGLVSIGFYDCKNADRVISDCIGLQVHTMSFDSTRLSYKSIELLRNLASIDVIVGGLHIQVEQ